MPSDNFVTWNQWEACHSDPEQLKRQKSASDKKITPISIDTQMFKGVFKGSKSDYHTTLSECSCVDFHLRKSPCKHMYRLAHELGLFALSNVVTLNTAVLHKDEALHIIQTVLNEDEQKQFRDFCYKCGNDNSGECVLSKEFALKLLSSNLAQEVVDVRKLLRATHIKNVRALFPPEAKRPRAKAELIESAIQFATKENIVFEDERMCLTLHQSIAHLGYALHRSLCTIYPTEPKSYWF